MRLRKGFLTLLLILLAGAFPVKAEAEGRIIALTENRENVLQISFFLQDDPGFNAVNLELIYDKELLTLTGMNAEDGLLKGASLNVSEGLLAFDRVRNIYEDGELLTAEFVLPGVNYDTQVLLSVKAMGNASGEEITGEILSQPVKLSRSGNVLSVEAPGASEVGTVSTQVLLPPETSGEDIIPEEITGEETTQEEIAEGEQTEAENTDPYITNTADMTQSQEEIRENEIRKKIPVGNAGAILLAAVLSLGFLYFRRRRR